jgi:hypothetical protein
MRTTIVPTFLSMGVATNVVPMHSTITVDMRNLPGDEGGAPERFLQHILRAAGVAVKGQAQRPCWRLGCMLQNWTERRILKVLAMRFAGLSPGLHVLYPSAHVVASHLQQSVMANQ